ncbi:type II toxin-antitoxin system HipA family toxin [Rodentibacter haemolyticus]|uniref:HipA domain-containing protein n=1 Tax=Rodentibacter haemolyticus TaxID=2778911 RepID=A0ABX6V0P5_9PAST|nr:HipA domain-containing protein [Rodentibacter haemolyticus]QPB43687.1 HipA domain-containing protein [Rodentibacter haemolyticus]
MNNLTLQIFSESQWVDVAILRFDTDYKLIDIQYENDYVLRFFDEAGSSAISINYPVDFFIERHLDWHTFLDDIVPAGASRRYWLEALAIQDLSSHQQNYLLLKHGAISPIGNLRIKEALPPEIEKRDFPLEAVLNRQSDFLEYAHQSGAIVGGATGAGGEAPKLLLRRKAQQVWIDNLQTGQENDDYYLVKFPRGKRTPLDCDILRAEFYYYQEIASMGFSTIDTHKMQLEEGDRYPSLWLPRFDSVQKNEKTDRLAVESVYSMLQKRGGELDQEKTVRQLIQKMVLSGLVMPDIEAFITEWLKRDLLNIAFGNSDNHGRNTSFLRNETHIWLAPIYDFAPMRADPDGIIRTMTWGRKWEQAGEYDFEGICELFADLASPEILFRSLQQLALDLVDLKARLTKRGVPQAILTFPAIGFDYLPEKLQRWKLL